MENNTYDNAKDVVDYIEYIKESEWNNEKISILQDKAESVLKQIASLQDQLEYQSSMASLFAKKLQEVWNIIDDFQGEHPELKVTALREVKNIIPSECDKWDKKQSIAYLFEYVSKLMDNGYQFLIKQDCTLKNYDYRIELYPEGVCYVFDYEDEDNEFIVLWEDLNE